MDIFEIKKTGDGSLTIYNFEVDEHYHSINGAFEESMHIFIKSGFQYCNKQDITIFEAGFGTGLNAILTLIEAEKSRKKVNYFSIEKYPLTENIFKQIDYSAFIGQNYQSVLQKIHSEEWNKILKISNNFNILKIHSDLKEFRPDFIIDITYFDAFSYEKQPDLWSFDIFKNIFEKTSENGILTTYASKGIIKQNLREAGFFVKRLAGPKGKRHIIRAEKQILF